MKMMFEKPNEEYSINPIVKDALDKLNAGADLIQISGISEILLIFKKKDSPNPNLNWSEAVDEALCFGWIDSTKKTIDKERYMQYVSKRKASSTWSLINKEKVRTLHFKCQWID